MPAKNVSRLFSEDSYYHIYNRGAGQQVIFNDDQDYEYFTSLFSRHIAKQPTQDKYGRTYKWLGDQLEALAYCWMPNHYHLMIYQKAEPRAIEGLMRSIGTAYTMYFNKKNKRKGALFETSYKASLILEEDYFAHVSRYIHLNPPNYINWQYSSYKEYTEEKTSDWIKPGYIMANFSSKRDYVNFVADYEDSKKNLDILKHELADS